MADRALDLLNAMGQTPDEIAAFLEGQGCKGWRHRPSTCPIANYMHMATGETYTIDPMFATYWGSDAKERSQTSMPPPASAFVARFDSGLYPSLIKEEAK